VIDVQAVLGELAECRQNRSDDAAVALMTLVAFFENVEVGQWLRDRLHSLAVKDPARVIILDGTQVEAARHVDDRCADHADCVRTRGEWIELGVKGSDAPTLQSAVAALVLPQAPVALVWASTAVAGDARLERLVPEMRTLVYNSSALDDGDAGLRALVEFVRTHPDAAICDLAYLRLAPWQDCIALCFDAKAVIRELFDLRRVEIASGSAAEAYYLIGWLASRLEWSLCASNRFCNRFGTEIEFSIVREGTPRRIRRIALHSSQTQFVAELAPETAEIIELRVSGAVQVPNRYRPINNIDTASLIEWAMLAAQRDRVFTDSLMAAADVLSRVQTTQP
jgi:glucose-6-phosphate dehydrogenase assembly protein OpcA